MVQPSAQTWPLGRCCPGISLRGGTVTAKQHPPAFSGYWLNDEGIKKKKNLIPSCLDTPEGDTVVRKAGLLGPWGPKCGPIG